MSLLSRVYNLAVLGRLKDDPGPFDPGRVKKILVVRNDNIGDVICTTPALDALRRAFPRAFIAALVCTLTTEAIAGHRALDKVWSYPKAKHRHYGPLESLWRMARVLGEIRREGFDLVVGFRADFSTSHGWLVYASRGRWRLGPRAQGKKRRWGFYYNLPAPPPPGDIHEVLRCFHLLKYIRVDSPEKRLYLEVPARARQKARDFLARQGLDQGPAPLVVNITRWAYRPATSWPEHKYRELVGRLRGGERPVVVTHAPADREWVEGILAGMDPRPPVFFSRSLKEFAALVARGRVFITAEGGPMHLAAAVGTPPLILWSATPLSVWRPWGIESCILGGRGPIGPITVDEVLQNLDRFLAQIEGLGSGDGKSP